MTSSEDFASFRLHARRERPQAPPAGVQHGSDLTPQVSSPINRMDVAVLATRLDTPCTKPSRCLLRENMCAAWLGSLFSTTRDFTP